MGDAGRRWEHIVLDAIKRMLTR